MLVDSSPPPAPSRASTHLKLAVVSDVAFGRSTAVELAMARAKSDAMQRKVSIGKRETCM